MKFLNILISIIIVHLLVSCQSETTVIELPTEIQLTVNNANGLPQKNAIVALFDDYATFLIQNNNFGTKGAAKQGKTDSLGFVRFDSLNPEKKYFVIAFTIDSTTFKQYGYKIHDDNSFTGYEFVRALNKSAITKATLNLRPAEAIVSFYADKNNAGSVPIAIYLDGDSIGTLKTTQTLDSVTINPSSQKLQNGHLTEIIRLGVEPTPLRFVNSINCNNIVELDLQAGKFNKINVNRCTAGAVAFYTGIQNEDKLNISVYLNGTNYIGEIDTAFARDPKDFKTAKTLNFVIDPPGIYSYVATSTGCVWMDNFTVTSNNITPIKLNTCQ